MIARSITLNTLSAGADTTASTVDSFFLAMTLARRVQKKAQEHIDALTQGERLPNMEDVESLPYIQAIVRETLRWRPAVPSGLTHSLTQDDEYDGMFMPAGTMVIANIWNMSMDSAYYPQPSEYNPDRFIENKDGQIRLKREIQNPEDFVFGFGRRICPGRHFAMKSIYISVATILAVFDISSPLDDAGDPIPPDTEYGGGLIGHPKPFQCIFTPRSESLLNLLSQQSQ
ncbi:cytochrome P450 [Sistotremastrum niveocremeum HHB9708]|uniref:Cytochrome P450 n=1 Tax=Sistotremastrum niveocremeum HHB9708 TaxID=1314777 RepID=A0A164YRA7_9AGAM|nr:cytochrome P450 [Sistotremastrum niveocremeum HHB9708]